MKTSPSPRIAFTLIEVMTSMALLSSFSLVVLYVINFTTELTSRASNQLNATRTARECLDLIGNDLRLSSRPYNGTVPTLQLDINSPAIAATYKQPHTLFCQSPVTRQDSYGNIAVIGYYVLRDLQVNTANSRFQLRRLYVDPENPTTPPAPSQYLVYSTPTDWHSSTLLAEFAPATAAADNLAAQKGWVADGVLAIWVRCLDPNGNPIVKKADGSALTYNFDSRTSYQYVGPSATNVIYPTSPTGGAPALPGFVEVSLVCVCPRDIARIKALPTPTAISPTNFYNEVQQFVTAARALNPSVGSIDSYSRKYRIYSGRDL